MEKAAYKNIFLLMSLLLLLSSCMKDDELWNSDNVRIFNPNKGMFIVNEGNFFYQNASLSYYDLETGECSNDVFFEANKLPLGDVAQSMVIRDTLGYVVVNNSGKIYVIDVNTFKVVNKITGLTSPRYMHFISDRKAYVTDLYSKNIAIVDPQACTITGHIDVNNHATDFTQHSTEQMIEYEHFMFVNCWKYDNKILVIDTDLDAVVDSIEVAKQPTSLVLDCQNKLWTVCDGCFPGSPYVQDTPCLLCIDAATRKIEKRFAFNFGDYPSEVKINASKDVIYFLNKHVYRHCVLSDEPPELLISSSYNGNHDSFGRGGFYGLAINPDNSDIYVANALNCSQPGIIERYNCNGDFITSFKVGIIPGEFCFKNKYTISQR